MQVYALHISPGVDDGAFRVPLLSHGARHLAPHRLRLEHGQPVQGSCAGSKADTKQ